MNNTTYRRAPGVLLREIDGELLLLNTDTDSYFGLNPSGASMYQHLADGATIQDTIKAICADYSISDEVVTNDLETLVDQLLARGLLLQESPSE